MSDQPINLVLEHLRAIRAELARLRGDVREVKSQQSDMARSLVAPMPQLHGFLSGSVLIPPGVDLTAPSFDDAFTVEQGDLHEAPDDN